MGTILSSNTNSFSVRPVFGPMFWKLNFYFMTTADVWKYCAVCLNIDYTPISLEYICSLSSPLHSRSYTLSEDNTCTPTITKKWGNKLPGIYIHLCVHTSSLIFNKFAKLWILSYFIACVCGHVLINRKHK